MARPISMEIAIGAPPETVFQTLTDFDRMDEWMPGFVRMETHTEGTMGVGSRFSETRKMMGKEHTQPFEITGFDPPRSMDLAAPSPSIDFAFRHVVEPRGEGGSLVTLISEAAPRSLGARLMLGTVGMRMIRKGCRRDLEAMKAYLESGASASSAP